MSVLNLETCLNQLETDAAPLPQRQLAMGATHPSSYSLDTVIPIVVHIQEHRKPPVATLADGGVGNPARPPGRLLLGWHCFRAGLSGGESAGVRHSLAGFVADVGAHRISHKQLPVASEVGDTPLR